MAYASGDVVSINGKVGQQNIRSIELPNMDDLLAGTYNLCLVKNEDGSISFKCVAPISDGTLSTISTLTVKGGIITAKA